MSPSSQSFPSLPPCRSVNKVAGPYTLSGEIGDGGMATVYVGHQIKSSGLRRPVAVKVMHEHLSRDADYKRRFLDEIRLVALIDHAFVCRIFDHGETVDGRPYFAMEYLLGEPLWRIFRALGREQRVLDASARLEFAVRVVADLAEGLHAAHEARDDRGHPLHVIHRDISPQNLFVMYDGTVRLVDFGVARHAAAQCRTKTGAVMGKLPYMAPEQVHGESYDRRLDVWALAVVLWELLAGTRLFRRATEMATLRAVCYDAVPRLTELGVADPELDAIVFSGLERKVALRIPTAREFATALYRYLARRGSQLTTSDISDHMHALFPESRLERERWARSSPDLDSEEADIDMQTRSPTQRWQVVLEEEARVWRAGRTETELDLPDMDEPTKLPPVSASTRSPMSQGSGQASSKEAERTQAPLEELTTTKRRSVRPFLEASTAPWGTGLAEPWQEPVALSTPRVPSDAVRSSVKPKARWLGLALGALVLGLPLTVVTLGARGASETPAAAQQVALSKPEAEPGHQSSRGAVPARVARSEPETSSAKAAPAAPAAPVVASVGTSIAGGSGAVRLPAVSGAHKAELRAAPPVEVLEPLPSEPAVEFGYAHVTTFGGQARVLENGAYLGTTPVRLRLPAGRHSLTLVPVAGGTGSQVAAVIQAGGTTLVSAELTVARREVEPPSEPAPHD